MILHGLMYVCFFYSLGGSSTSKEQPVESLSHVCCTTVDGLEIHLPVGWVSYSAWLQRKKKEQPRLGTDTTSPIPFLCTQFVFDTLYPYMDALAKNDTALLASIIQKIIGGNEKKLLVISQRIKDLNEFYNATKILEIARLESLLRIAYSNLLKKEQFIQAFMSMPEYFDQLDIPQEIQSATLNVLSEGDQEYLRAQLCRKIPLPNQTDFFSLSPSGRYAAVWGNHKQTTVSVINVRSGELLHHLPVEEIVNGCLLYADTKLLIWGPKKILLGDSLGTLNRVDEWEKNVEGATLIWGIAVSSDRQTCAVASGNKVCLYSINNQTLRATCTLGAMFTPETEENKKRHLLFIHHDLLLAVFFPDGEHAFFNCLLGVLVMRERPVESAIIRWYINGSQLTTLSENSDLCVWKIKDGQVKFLKKDTTLSTHNCYHSRGSISNRSFGQKLIFCDTSSDDFATEVPFVLGTPVPFEICVEEDGLPFARSHNGSQVKLHTSSSLISCGISSYGEVFLGITEHHDLYVWHFYNRSVQQFLAKQTLKQGLILQAFVNELRKLPHASDSFSFMSKPHVKKAFEESDATFRELIAASCPALHAVLCSGSTQPR